MLLVETQRTNIESFIIVITSVPITVTAQGLGMRRLNENADYIIGPCFHWHSGTGILQLEVFQVCFIHVVLIHGMLTCRRLPCRAS